jgi:hypothetical protein
VGFEPTSPCGRRRQLEAAVRDIDQNLAPVEHVRGDHPRVARTVQGELIVGKDLMSVERNGESRDGERTLADPRGGRLREDGRRGSRAQIEVELGTVGRL